MDDTTTKPSSSEQSHEQEAMLNELESIKELLFEDDNFDEYDIPVLDHTIDSEDLTSSNSLDINQAKSHGSAAADDIQEQHSDTATEAQSAPAQVDEKPLTAEQSSNSDENPEPINQPSLFQDPSTALSSHHTTVKAQGENPFLPKHIRDRLQGNRTTSSNITQPLPVQLEADQILDEIINQFLPAIETKLRARLKPLVDRQLAKVDSANDAQE